MAYVKVFLDDFYVILGCPQNRGRLVFVLLSENDAFLFCHQGFTYMSNLGNICKQYFSQLFDINWFSAYVTCIVDLYHKVP